MARLGKVRRSYWISDPLEKFPKSCFALAFIFSPPAASNHRSAAPSHCLSSFAAPGLSF